MIMIRKNILLSGVFLGLMGTLFPLMIRSNDDDALDIMNRAQAAFYYAGKDMKARVVMELIDKKGSVRKRVLTMLRVNEDPSGRQRFFIYFHEPGDVRRMTFLVWKYTEREDDRWIYIPAVDLVRRIAAEDKRSSFVGSDFTYEDVSGRDLSADRHRFMGEDRLDDRAVFVIESVPLEKAEYSRKVSYVDQETYLPLKEEYHDARGNLFRVFKVEEIRSVKAGNRSFPTVVKRSMLDLRTGHRTVVTFDRVSYNNGLKADDFNERHMRRPPRPWIR